SYSSSSDEFDESNSSGSLEKIVSHKGPSKDLKKWYEDEEDKDEEDNEKDEEQDDETDDSDEEFWTPKSKGTSGKSIRTPKRKVTSSKSMSGKVMYESVARYNIFNFGTLYKGF
ncbi:hypothetical protein Tco_0665995, partial [Tanacetum coccineum]